MSAFEIDAKSARRDLAQSRTSGFSWDRPSTVSQ